MKIVSNLIFGTARALEGATLDGTEGELALVSALSPVIKLVAPLQNLAAFLNTLQQRESFCTFQLSGMAASSAALNTVLCSFARGLWRIAWSLSGLSNFTQASDGTVSPAARVVLVDPVAGASVLGSVLSVNAVPQIIRQTYEFLFPRDGYSLELRQSATGVAQTQVAEVSLVVSRLL